MHLAGSKEERDAPATNSPGCDKTVSKSGEKRNGKRNARLLNETRCGREVHFTNPGVSIQNKINMLNERLMNKSKGGVFGKRGLAIPKRERKRAILERLTVEDTAAGHGSSPYLKCMRFFAGNE